MNAFEFYVRWRPLAPSESSSEIVRSVERHDNAFFVTLSSLSNKDKERKSGAPFTQPFNPVDDNNKRVFQSVVAPSLPFILDGSTHVGQSIRKVSLSFLRDECANRSCAMGWMVRGMELVALLEQA
ncbi:uncharacterized protein BDV17DRAFT_296188 [Aspergillus undulatus]|uniref:uncharacterized protein n=1 Tax=Aspergillus undulatus TaxID=1810928 RepID=UPI003CCD6F7D